MDVFSAIDGLSGETMSSALFRYLVLNSQEIRDSVVSFLSDKSPIGPIGHLSHFSCQTEYPTTHAEYGNGRLDILLQLDDVVIGIESKFFTKFQDNQPQKYYETIKTVANSLSSITRHNVRSIVYILCPDSRRNEALLRLEGLENSAVITWEEMLKVCSAVVSVSNPVAKVVRDEFARYLERQFSFIYDFEKKAVHLRKIFPDYGTPLQAEFVAKLWAYLPSSGPRISNGPSWIGYYFYSNSQIAEKGWFGFVPATEIRDRVNNDVELIIASTYKPELSGPFKEVQLVNDNFIGAPGRTYYWVVNFDSTWNNVEKWRRELSPFWSAIKDEDEIN